ncbi:MAG TPA: hypothetical protein VEI01_21135 [Terriglobales bacterium]|nr:hypothetical protein [Terriglobales bacterium]
MTHFPQPHPTRRAPRVQLGGSVLAAIRFDDGQRSRGKLYSVSVTGGLLKVAKALAEGDFVEIGFQTKVGTVIGMAEMLSPLRTATDGVLQAFRFIALGDDDHRNLRMAVQSVADQNFLGRKSRPMVAPKSL